MFVHGAWHGSWCWEPVRTALVGLGVATAGSRQSVGQPTRLGSARRRRQPTSRARRGRGPRRAGRALLRRRGRSPTPVRIRTSSTLVYLTAFALDAGESVHAERVERWRRDEARPKRCGSTASWCTSHPARVVEFFYHDCAPDVARPRPRRGCDPCRSRRWRAPRRAAAWREKPSTYVVCTDDRAIPVALQRSCAARVDAVVELPTSHSPFLSRPDDVAGLLAGSRRARSAPAIASRAKFGQRRDAVVVGVEMELVGVHQHGMQTGRRARRRRRCRACRRRTTPRPRRSPWLRARDGRSAGRASSRRPRPSR